jgi:WXXGXW repeat (2 copies)
LSLREVLESRDKTKEGQEGKLMKFTRLLKNSIGAAVLAGALFMVPAKAHAGVFVSVAVAPPAIPVYEQPVAPGDGYIWTPGYWAWTGDGYEWVDGAWVNPPYVNALWTPGYWGYGNGGYFWNAGYWGPTIGYYGGINYGFGYFGTGFYGGYWGGGHFWYNRAYNNIGWRGGYIYNRPYNGFSGRPGGVSYARAAFNGGNRGSFVGGNHVASNFAGNHGASNFAGNNRESNFAANRGSNFNSNQGSVNRATYGGFGNNATRPSYNGAASYNSNGYRSSAPAQATQGRSYTMNSQPRQNFGGSNGGYGGGSSFHGSSMSSGNSFHGSSAPSGGSFHGGGGGGGGGFHGGGGGGSHGGHR